MDRNKARDMQHHKGHLGMNTPPIVSRQEWEAARQQMLVKEKALSGPATPWPPSVDGCRGWRWRRSMSSTGPRVRSSLLDLFEGRRQLIIYRAFFEPGVFGLARARLSRLLPGRRSGRPPGPSERSRHYPRLRLARTAGGHRAPEDADGLGDALVHNHRQLRHGLRRRRMARPQRVLPRRRQGVPHLLYQ